MILQDDILAAQELNRNLDANFGYVDLTLGRSWLMFSGPEFNETS